MLSDDGPGKIPEIGQRPGGDGMGNLPVDGFSHSDLGIQREQLQERGFEVLQHTDSFALFFAGCHALFAVAVTINSRAGEPVPR